MTELELDKYTPKKYQKTNVRKPSPIFNTLHVGQPHVLRTGEFSYLETLEYALKILWESLESLRDVINEQNNFERHILKEYENVITDLNNKIVVFKDWIAENQEAFQTIMDNKFSVFTTDIIQKQDTFERDFIFQYNNFKEEINNSVKDLKKYIDFQLTDLNIPEKIMQKIEDMASSGEFVGLIQTLLERSLYYTFNSLEDLKKNTSLVAGNICQTLGFYNINDGGGATYQIVEQLEILIDEEDEESTPIEQIIPNGRSIIQLTETLFATLIYDNVINIKQLGAIGDGENDETEVFQTALDLNKGNLIINVFKGIYNITKTLITGGNTTLNLHDAIIIKKHNKPLLLNGYPEDGFEGYSGNGNIIINGGIIDSHSDYPEISSFFSFGHASNISLINTTFKNCMNSHAVEFAGCENILVDGCKFLGHIGSAVEYREAVQFELCNTLGFNYFGLEDFTPCRNVRVLNCLVDKDEENPSSEYWQAGFGHHGQTTDVWQENFIFENNVINNCTFGGIRTFKFNNVLIKNNIIKGCARGILISNDPLSVNLNQTSKNIRIIDNKITGATVCGLWLNGSIEETCPDTEDVYVENNIIETITGGVIYSKWVNRLTFINNKIYTNNQNGIEFWNLRNAVIENNYVENASRGMFFKDTTLTNRFFNNVSINNNTLVGCKTVGIWFNAVANALNIAKLIKITRNTIKNTTGSAIYLKWLDNCDVINNVIDVCSSTGIDITDTSNLNIESNKIINAGIYGILTTNTSTTVFVSKNIGIKNNHIINSTNYALNIRGLKGFIINNNLIRNIPVIPIYINNLCENGIIANNQIMNDEDKNSVAYVSLIGAVSKNIQIIFNTVFNYGNMLNANPVINNIIEKRITDL